MSLRKPARGITLIETLVTMTLLVIVMTLAGALLEIVLRVERSGREQQARTIATLRLARLFRSDIHAAESAEAPASDPPGSSLSLRLDPASRVTYEMNRGRLTRIVRFGDSVLTRESFQVSIGQDPRFEIAREPTDRQIIRLRLDESARASIGEPAVCTIEAVLGSDHRYRERSTP
jgi:type II secretory pathway pseudopilin PulG